MKNQKNEIRKLEEKIQVIKDTKIRFTDVQTLAELDQVVKQAEFDALAYAVQTYIAQEKKGNASLENSACVVGITRKTFSGIVKHWKEFGELPKRTKRSKPAWNRIDDEKRMNIINAVQKVLDDVEKFAKEDVPTIVHLLYFHTTKQMKEDGTLFEFSLSTFRRIISEANVEYNLKYETKLGRKLRKRLLKLQAKLKELKAIEAEVNKKLEIQTKEQGVLANEKSEEKKCETRYIHQISKRRNIEKAGLIVSWDGSLDQHKDKSKVTRMQSIDQKTLETMAISFVRNENNHGFQMLISQMIDNYGIPEVILGDKRKGVDPTDEGALNAIVCKLLGITLHLDSNSIHKAELESLNGKMHPFITYYSARNKLDTIQKLNDNSRDIVQQSNEYFKRTPQDYSHLRQAPDEIKDILRGKIVQCYVKSADGIVINKRAYQAYDSNGNVVALERHTWAIVAFEGSKPIKIWTMRGVFKLKRIHNELKHNLISADKFFEMTERHFIDNEVILLNRETYDLLYEQAMLMGEKKAIKTKRWMLDKQIQEQLAKKKELARK